MIDLALLFRIIEPEAQALGFDLVRVKMTGGAGDPTLQVMAERPDTRQLTIEDCADLSRRISDRMDALEAEGRDPIAGAYRLEVSSPGIDRPLTRLKDYIDWQGHEARVVLTEKIDGRKQFKGDLAGIEPMGDVVLIALEDGTQARLPFGRIEGAKLVLTDRLIAATRPLSTEGADEFEDDASDETQAEEQH